jgi:hypothetical protein
MRAIKRNLWIPYYLIYWTTVFGGAWLLHRALAG